MSHVFHRVLDRTLPEIARGDGALLWDTAGRRYIDASGGAIVVNVGHGRTEIAEAMARQAGQAAYVHGTQFTSGVLEEYARRLAVHVPGDCTQLYLVSGGSEANETAVKMARSYHLACGSPLRHKVLRRSISYHGNTLGTLALSGRASLRAPYLPLFCDTPSVPAPLAYHCPLGRPHDPECDLACADAIEDVILREGPETIAALILEPVMGASAGAVVPPEGYDRRARALCDRYGLLLIADEVMTGFGRTGRFFASEGTGLQPDLVTCGKGMAGGYMPVGAVLASVRVHAALVQHGAFVNGFTFSHHAVTAAACLATLDILEREGLVARAAALGDVARARLEQLRRHDIVGDVRGRGLMLAVELVADRATRRPFPRADRLAERLTWSAFQNGLVLYPATAVADGTDGDALMFAPPFVITTEQIEDAVAILDRTLAAHAA
jgi:adenosylmethionine-8-amino-7-oxononanoate aminotransferase